MLIILLYSILL